MTVSIDSPGDAPKFSEPELAYIREHHADLQAMTTAGHFLRWSLTLGFVLGLIAHIVGYVLRTSLAGEPFALLADLVYTLGLALWSGVVVAFFVQVFPETKRRQLKEWLDAYEALDAARKAGPRHRRASR